MKIVPWSRSGTYVATLEGAPGETHERSCGVCEGRLVAGDDVSVTASHGRGGTPEVQHALSHYPDCVKALAREKREGR